MLIVNNVVVARRVTAAILLLPVCGIGRRDADFGSELAIAGAEGQQAIPDRQKRDRATRDPVITSLSASWPDLFRPSTSCLQRRRKDVDARHKAGHDGEASVLALVHQRALLDHRDRACAISHFKRGSSLSSCSCRPARPS
jgi:hypothetical protein